MISAKIHIVFAALALGIATATPNPHEAPRDSVPVVFCNMSGEELGRASMQGTDVQPAAQPAYLSVIDHRELYRAASTACNLALDEFSLSIGSQEGELYVIKQAPGWFTCIREHIGGLDLTVKGSPTGRSPEFFLNGHKIKPFTIQLTNNGKVIENIAFDTILSHKTEDLNGLRDIYSRLIEAGVSISAMECGRGQNYRYIRCAFSCAAESCTYPKCKRDPDSCAHRSICSIDIPLSNPCISQEFREILHCDCVVGSPNPDHSAPTAWSDLDDLTRMSLGFLILLLKPSVQS